MFLGSESSNVEYLDPLGKVQVAWSSALGVLGQQRSVAARFTACSSSLGHPTAKEGNKRLGTAETRNRAFKAPRGILGSSSMAEPHGALNYAGVLSMMWTMLIPHNETKYDQLLSTICKTASHLRLPRP